MLCAWFRRMHGTEGPLPPCQNRDGHPPCEKLEEFDWDTLPDNCESFCDWAFTRDPESPTCTEDAVQWLEQIASEKANNPKSRFYIYG